MRILVTGGAGFIGSHIVDAYLKMGHQVVVIDDLSTGDIKNLNSGAQFYKQDICVLEIEEIFKKHKFEIVNHHAAQINVRTSLANPLFDARVNILGSLNLLNLSARYKIKRFIFASSGGAIYGEPKKFPITENFPLIPLSPYGVAKIATENYIRVFARLYNFDYVILRYSNVYGPRQIPKGEAGVISIFIKQILHNDKCYINGDGNQIRDYVFVDDVVRANILALDSISETFNIGTNIGTSVNDLIEILKIVTDRDIQYEHRPPIPGEVFKNILDYSKAKRLLNWKPTVSIRDGIAKTYQFFLNGKEKIS
uniref:NAD-dependent epimerase/dehydratase family protein n=1 Tax=candidate division WOR-3 bacterium TaxID=2052148 RepID=A0A7C4TE88_UNCW3